jgi:zinc protease
MRARPRLHPLFLLSLIAAMGGLVGAAPQTTAPAAPADQSPQAAPLTAAIPVDPQITVGQFPNGLRYYIRQNKKPEQRAELRLAINAGSILEDDDQQGLAHFVEHMAFNGTKNFPKQDLVKFMESIGMRFGPSVNAFTSFDETVFQLQVPTDKPDVLDRSMLILEDWAHNVSFDPVEIDKERGVVIEEWRLGRGAGARLRDKQFPVLLQGSRYADRLPIGKPEILQSFKPETLTRFYKDWYRPDLMAVVAVGDFDKAAIEALIRKHFASIPAAATKRARTVYPVPDFPGTRYTIATDKELTSTTVSIYNPIDARDQTTIGAYRRQIVESLYGAMLSDRFAEMTQKPDAPFLGAGASRGAFVRSKEASTLGAAVKEDGIEAGLDALFTESTRVARFGFTATELARQKQNLLRSLERAVAEKDTQPSSSYAAEFIRNFTDREPIPGIVYENELYKRFLPEITLDEINTLARNWSPDRNRIVVVSAPDKPGLVVPTAARLTAVIGASDAKSLTAFVDTVGDAPLFTAAPTPGAVVRTTTKDALGITEWQLANGVKVVLKPTTFKEDEIVFRGFSPGGTSLASDADYIPARTASSVIASSGLGQFNRVDLVKKLAGKQASAGPQFSEVDEGVGGGSSKKDLETMFQLIYMTFTEPRADAQIFQAITTQTKAALANQRAQPEFWFQEALQGALSQGHLRAKPITAETIDQMNLEKSMAFYKDRFADASDFTFVFVGSFDLPTMKPLVEKYLGGLPSTHRTESWKDVGMRYPTGVIEKRVEKGIEPKSQTSIVFTGPFVYDQAHRVTIRAMASVLETRLREALREDLGGTYSVGASAGYAKIPVQSYSVSISFGSNPDRTDELTKAVFREIEALKTSGPTDKQVADAKEGFLRDNETNTKQNGYLLSQMAFKYQYGEDVADVFAMNDYYNRITAAAIQEAAKTYLNEKNYVKVSLFPEKK